MSKPAVKKARQPEFIGSDPETSLYFRGKRVYIKVHRDKLPKNRHFSKPTLILSRDAKLEIFTEILRFLYVKKIEADRTNYLEILNLATVYDVHEVERELLFNINSYLTYHDILDFGDLRLLTVFKKKLMVCFIESLRYLIVQSNRKLRESLGDYSVYFAVYGEECECHGSKACRYLPSEPGLQYLPPEGIRCLAKIECSFDREVPLVQISFTIQDIYGHAKARIHVIEDYCSLARTVECMPCGMSLVPYGQVMVANFSDFVLAAGVSYKFIIELEGSIFVDNTPDHAKVTITMRGYRMLKYHFNSLPLRKINRIDFSHMSQNIGK